MSKTFSGVNIQYPISSAILDGSKTVETRFYPLPAKYVNKQLVMIETPGRSGKFKARIVGFIIFGESYKYQTAKAFYAESKKHKVEKTSPWAWVDGKIKWAWPVKKIVKLREPVLAPKKKGIRFTTDIPFNQ